MLTSFLRYFLLVMVLYCHAGFAQSSAAKHFTVVPLGVKGGLDESNLSAYLVAPFGTQQFICADAGTIGSGIDKAIAKSVFKTTPAVVLRNYIKGYLISHGHLDHVSGLIINSPDDTAKPIYAMPYVIDVLKNKYFTWESWANFGNEGEKPVLNKYRYQALNENESIDLNGTGMTLQAFTLSHAKPYLSTAFLLSYKNHYVLYLGDTGSDELEQSDKLGVLWQAVAPLIKSQRLHAIFIEVSFPNAQPDKQLFGHLTPRLLFGEMNKLAALTGNAALRNVNVVVTHMKPTGDNEKQIKSELKTGNKTGLKFIFPVQGEALNF